MKRTKRHGRILEGPPMDDRAEALADVALEAFGRVTRLRRALGEADRAFIKAAREFRRYYNNAA